MQTFGIGTVLGTAWRVWKRNLVPFALISLLIYLPALVLRFQLAPDDWALYMVPISLLLGALIAAALTYGVVMELNGTRPSFRDCIVIGFGQLLSVVGVVIVSLLGMSAGLLLLVVPGVIVMLMWYVAVPVAIIEKLGVMDSLRRSRELTQGHKSQLFAIVLVTALASFGLDLLMNNAMAADVLAFVGLARDAILTSFNAVVTAVIYTTLRHAKDGTSVPELATAFARLGSRAS